ncbi:FAD-dependent monooxygenase [Leptospira ilyithenensis]|uniref:2-polyprenyl-6-methoxyphenol hydroxylase n=1 Tax=Leptospira ilyithenensis TaxID=2484901 RepID=A0A4R9LVF3_9LEPT|nr:FAD-dependent monooxygenase [Leptospira ilyithenensis]TGN16798.1 2-polyprenyl-6-methoxyphenol hydroxylase [Leptospira ilyithenensis]
MIQTPVLVVGGGPVGLALSLTLSKYGINSYLINNRSTTTNHPRLDVVNCRSMEIFRRIGLSDKIRNAGNPISSNQYCSFAASANGPYYSVMSDRNFIYQPVKEANRKLMTVKDGSLPLESMQRIPQMHLEPVLLEEAEKDPNIEVRFGWELFGFEQDETGVTALIQNVETGENTNIRSEYLIGCDGALSKVRNFLNIDYEGTRDLLGELFIIHLKSDEISSLYPNKESYWHTWISNPEFTGLLVSPDASKNDFILHRPFAPKKGESVESVIDKAIGKKLKYEVIQSGPWRPQFIVAESFGHKRVFIVGDATHQYMPTGGLGMNTGLCEAYDLSWKLAAVLRGWGGMNLLDSYESERRPIALRNREHVKKCAASVFEAQFARNEKMLDDSKEGESIRIRMKHEFETKVSRLYESLGIEIGYRYQNSPIIEKEEGQEPPYEEIKYIPTTWPGSRLPSVFRKDGTALFDELGTGEFTLLVLSESTEDTESISQAAQKLNVPLKIIKIEETEIGKVYEKKFILVRPDEHVAWRGDRLPSDSFALLNKVRGEK